MMCFDVPFVPDGDYPDFLADHANSLASVHFSLHHPSLIDARQRMVHHSTDDVIAGLTKLGNLPKYALMNSRLHASEAYFDTARINASARTLESLIDTVNLRGIIFADPYFLQTLSDAHSEMAAHLEAVPSVNCMLDSADKIFAMLSMIDETKFKPPTRLVVDRSLNRNILELTKIKALIRDTWPDMHIHLIANEGCLYQCPYKPAHDAHVSVIVEGLCGERTFAINRDFGCVRRLLADPGTMLASPFIRPEDVDLYANLADGIKLCGRNKGIDFLKRTVAAYQDQKYNGNLLDLMDAMGDLAHKINIPNHELPKYFAKRVTSCDKHCRVCGWCTELAETISIRNAHDLTHL